jgi:predicted RNA-binding Zn ribbon-like protein
VAAKLVNLLMPGEERGKTHLPPEGPELAARLNSVFASAGSQPKVGGHSAAHFFSAAARSGLSSRRRPMETPTASCATALAIALASEVSARLGVCAAPHCDRVYVDTSRNGSRRFCSAACQSRVKAAAFRARRA